MVNYTLNLALQLSAEGFGVFNWDGSKSNFMDCLKQQKCIGKQEIDLKKDFNIFKKCTIMFAIVGDSVLKNECKESIVLEIIKDKKYQP